MNYLKVFDSVCYAQIPKKKRHKLDETNEKCIFVGYTSMYKVYRLYNLKTNKVIVRLCLFLRKWFSGNHFPNFSMFVFH